MEEKKIKMHEGKDKNTQNLSISYRTQVYLYHILISTLYYQNLLSVCIQ